MADIVFTDITMGLIEMTNDEENQHIVMKLDELDGGISFSWSYRETTFPFIEDHGTGTAFLSSVSGTVACTPDFNEECGNMGKAIDIVSTAFDIGSFSIHLDGGASALYNAILDSLNDVFEDIFSAFFNDRLAQAGAEIINNKLFNIYSYIAIHSGGYAFPASEGPMWDGREKAGILPGPLTNQVNDEDLQYMISNTSFESLYLSGLTLGLLEGTIDPSTVSDPRMASMLTTSTLGSICPGLYEAYPDAPIRLDLEASIMPTVSVMPSAVFTNVTGILTVSVSTEGEREWERSAEGIKGVEWEREWESEIESNSQWIPALEIGYSAGMAGIPGAWTEDYHGIKNKTSFTLDYSPYNTTAWGVSSQFGDTYYDTAASM
ncbi:hypothetical protein KIPB_006876 [Kipferlia bialata]|uniref:Uncharacterized protein n=1 Tax=Kipferlia bialata TaxID=797122 RepID=A0A9K3CXN1_9EUKA|nr:hypothetical protein KIPB_006876 [Kipferlia bialata]|eukprot:g6876.t1